MVRFFFASNIKVAGGKLQDRWLKHINESDDNKYIEAGEELRISRHPFYDLIKYNINKYRKLKERARKWNRIG